MKTPISKAAIAKRRAPLQNDIKERPSTAAVAIHNSRLSKATSREQRMPAEMATSGASNGSFSSKR